jgi:hypothetical protein
MAAVRKVGTVILNETFVDISAAETAAAAYCWHYYYYYY